MTWITDSIAISGKLRTRDISWLSEQGIQAVLDLREEGSDDPALMERHGIDFLHIPVRDHTAPSQPSLREAAHWVLGHRAAGRSTLVHCREGIGRSAVAIACVLIHQGFEMAGAVSLLRSRRWGISLRRGQKAALAEYAETLAVHKGESDVPPTQ